MSNNIKLFPCLNSQFDLHTALLLLYLGTGLIRWLLCDSSKLAIVEQVKYLVIKRRNIMLSSNNSRFVRPS